MDLMTLNRAVGALEEAAAGPEHPLCDEAFVDALLRLVPCDAASLTDLDARHQSSEDVDLVSWPVSEVSADAFWEHYWSTASCSFPERGMGRAGTTTDFYGVAEWRRQPMYHEFFKPSGVEWCLVLPLMGPAGVSRRLVLFRAAGSPFGEKDKALVTVLRPHVVEALRAHSRGLASQVLTPRQQELIRLCAEGLDNTRIARRVGVSTDTVRKHLENAFARLDVSSRGQAVVAVMPDLAWS